MKRLLIAKSHVLKRIIPGVVITVLAFSAQSQSSGCQDQVASTTGARWANGAKVYVDLGNLNDEQKRQVQQALTSMNDSNKTNGSNVTFSLDSPAPAGAAHVTFLTGPTQSTDPNKPPPPAQTDSNGCVDGSGNRVCSTITFSTNSTAPNSSGQTVTALDETSSEGGSTAFLKAALHELGHTMGMGDTVQSSGNCAGQTAGGSVMNGLCGANDYANNMPTSVPDCDWQRVSTEYTTLPCDPQQSNACYYGGGVWDSTTCTCYNDPPQGCDQSQMSTCNANNGNWDTQSCTCSYQDYYYDPNYYNSGYYECYDYYEETDYYEYSGDGNTWTYLYSTTEYKGSACYSY